MGQEMQEKNIEQKGRKPLSRFLPLFVLLVLMLIAVGLGARVKNEQSRLMEEKSNAVVQERPAVNVVEQELIPGRMRDRINLLHAADLADAIVAALLAEVRGVFNVGGPSAVSIAEIAAACIEIAESGNVILPADDVLKGTLKYDLDYGKATAAFGYVPRVCLREGLRRSMLGQF